MDRKCVLEAFENEDFERLTCENIEKYRKGDFKITLRSKNKKDVSGANVKVKQLKHEFKFGANIFMLDELETDEKNVLYKEYFKNTFNMATLPFYWSTIEPQKGHLRYEKGSSKWYRRPAIDLCIEFCEQNGIEPREHALAYEHLFPSWLKDASIDEIKSELERRFCEISTKYASKIPTIEVTNEMNWPHDSGATAFYNDPEYVLWCFKLAEKYFPNNQLVINESTEECWGDNCRTTDKYYSYTEVSMLKGARIDAIGMQFHMFYDRSTEIQKASYLYNPKCLYDHMNMYSSLKNALQVTEITIPAYSNDALDEEIQARLLVNLYKTWFSHPAMEQIIYWNLVDGYAYVPDPTPEEIRRTQGDMTVGENVYYGGLIRFDMTPKPAYIALNKLINEEWHTEECATTDASGSVSLRGFYGDYELEIELDGKTVTKEFKVSKKESNEIYIEI